MRKIFFFILMLVFINALAMDKSESFKQIQQELNKSNKSDISIIVELEDAFEINTSEDQGLRRSANMKAGLMSRLSRLGTREHKRFRNLPIMALQVNEKSLQELQKSQAVRKVYQNKLRRHSLRSSTVQVQADIARLDGYTGEAITIAVVDAGFNSNHDMFGSFTANRFVEEACFTTRANINGIQLYGNCSPNNSQTRIGYGASFSNCNPCAAGNDHGNLVAGIALGNAFQESPRIKGIATKSNLIAINVFSRVVDENFCGFDPDYGPSCVVALDSDVLAGLDHVYSLRNKHDIAAVNLSLGSGAFNNSCDAQSVYTNIINRFHNIKIAVIASAGNDGSGTTISEPACVSNAIAVGSVGDTNAVSVFSDSNQLIDFWAPGESILTSGVDYVNHYKSVSGTSFSAPHVSGAYAILKSFNNQLTVDEITTALKTSGLPITDPLNGITRPLIQISDALDLAPRPLGIIPILQLLLLDQ